MGVQVGLQVATYFSPDDNTQEVFLDFIRATKHQLRLAVYGLHLPPLVDTLLALHRTGVDVRLVLDRIQAAGTAEKPEVQTLIQADLPIRIGTSQRHRIMHHKFAVRDTCAVLAGSWNFSESASLENNYFDVVENADRAAMFIDKWQEIWDWVSANESQYQFPGSKP